MYKRQAAAYYPATHAVSAMVPDFQRESRSVLRYRKIVTIVMSSKGNAVEMCIRDRS